MVPMKLEVNGDVFCDYLSKH